jgi:hypothetical protein
MYCTDCHLGLFFWGTHFIIHKLKRLKKTTYLVYREEIHKLWRKKYRKGTAERL